MEVKYNIREIFLPIDGYENYAVSNHGNVKNTISGRVLSPTLNNMGYQYISLCSGKGTTPKKVLVHRLVATTWIMNPDDLPCCDHIDRIPTHNYLSNLRWANQSQNIRNSTISKKNTTGAKGVTMCKKTNKFVAQLMHNAKHIHLGTFSRLEDAIQARKAGDFASNC